jgi:hypothetical protein
MLIIMFGVALQYSGDESIDVPHSQRVFKDMGQ